MPVEEATGNRRRGCLADALPVCSQGTGKSLVRVLTPQGCAASDGMTRGDVFGKREARRESATVVLALSFMDTNRGGLAGKWKHSLMFRVGRDLAKSVLLVF